MLPLTLQFERRSAPQPVALAVASAVAKIQIPLRENESALRAGEWQWRETEICLRAGELPLRESASTAIKSTVVKHIVRKSNTLVETKGSVTSAALSGLGKFCGMQTQGVARGLALPWAIFFRPDGAWFVQASPKVCLNAASTARISGKWPSAESISESSAVARFFLWLITGKSRGNGRLPTGKFRRA